MNLDENSRVIGVGENVGLKNSANINMEMYIMKTDLFIDMIYECIRGGRYKKIKNYIINAYFDANMDFLNEKVNKELFYSKFPIYTKPKDACPTQYTVTSNVINSIIANGSYIEGEVKNCVIGRNVWRVSCTCINEWCKLSGGISITPGKGK